MRNKREPYDVKDKIYEIDGKQYTFAGLCAHYAIKYKSLYSRVKHGMEINEAVQECIMTPRTWGATFSNGRVSDGLHKVGRKPANYGKLNDEVSEADGLDGNNN